MVVALERRLGLPLLVAVLAVGIGLFTGTAWAQDAETPAEPAATEAPAEPAAETAETPADEAAPAAEASAGDLNGYAIDNMMLFLAAVLVLFMQAGFAMVETGLNAAKNAVNILFKNFMDMCIGVLLFFLVGYGLMYPGWSEDDGYEVLGFAQVGIGESSTTAETTVAGKLDPQVDFLFQVAFAATAATIVSGAVAGRMQFISYLVYSAVITGLVYPISGSWKWGYGWLADMGFHDFAGSVVVHAVGGFAGLAGAIVLGSRIGKYGKDGKVNAMPGHNLALATLGVFVLWVGWYGFNPGSQLAFTGGDNTNAVVLIAVNTTLAAAAGGLASMILSWVLFKKPDLTMALNGALAGLVGITANCDCVTNVSAVLIGLIAGCIVVAGILLLDKLKIDDPVGAFPVHGMCGVWGCIAAAVFGGKAWMPQIVGSVVIPLWAFVTMGTLFLALKAMGILRVSAEEELEGLDLSEHGMHAYPPTLVVDTFTGTGARMPLGGAPSGSPAPAPAPQMSVAKS